MKESESKRRDESKFIDLGGLDGSGAGDLIIPDGDFVQEKGEGRFPGSFNGDLAGGEGLDHDCMDSSGRERLERALLEST